MDGTSGFDWGAAATNAGNALQSSGIGNALQTNFGQMSGNQLAQGVGATAGAVAAGSFGIPPQFGSAIGGYLGSLFGGNSSSGAAGAFNGYHSTTLESLVDASVKAPDQQIFLHYATTEKISVEEVARLMEYDCRRCGGVSPKDMWDGWALCNTSMADLIKLHNLNNSDCIIIPGVPGPLGVTGPLRVLANYNGVPDFVYLQPKTAGGSVPTSAAMAGTSPKVNQGLPLPTSSLNWNQSANGFTTDDLKNIGKGIVKGAWDGGVKAAANTDEGKQATSVAAQEYVKDKAIWIAGGGILAAIPLTLLIAKAFRK